MDLEKWQEGLNKCIDHIIQLKEDGDLLLNKESYAHAYFCYYTALEELATANFILNNIDDPVPEDLKKIIYSHEKKRTLAVSNLYFPDLEDYSDLIQLLKEDQSKKKKITSIEELYSFDFKIGEKIEQKENLWYWRKRAIFTTLNQSCTDFLSPNELTKNHVKDIKLRLDIGITQLQAGKDSYFEFKDEIAPKKNIKDDKIPIKLINQWTNLLELIRFVSNGNLEAITQYNGVSPELRDLFISFLTNQDFNESLIESSFEKISSMFQDLIKIDEPQPGFEKEMNDYYNERLLYYDSDYIEKINQVFYDFLEKTTKKYIKKVDKDEEINKSDSDLIVNLVSRYLGSLFNTAPESQNLIEEYKNQLNKNPIDLEILFKLGNLHLEKENYQESYEYFEKIHNIDKTNINALFLLAEIEFRINDDLKKAIKYYEKVLKLNSEIKEVWFSLGQIYELLKKNKNAIKSYWNSVFLDFNLEESWLSLGRIYLNLGKIKEALVCLNVVLKINPFHEEANNLLNKIYSAE